MPSVLYRKKEFGKLNIFCKEIRYFKRTCEEFWLSQLVKLFEINNLAHPELFTIAFRITSSIAKNVQLAEPFHPLKEK